jgi:hypothetical protein
LFSVAIRLVRIGMILSLLLLSSSVQFSPKAACLRVDLRESCFNRVPGLKQSPGH